ncbi:alpha/beta hydrolase [Microbacterium sp. X-17]|uniref:alpha/beta hydrolase n=1 Tax=Microbacterium sp. X-17 TaxID=3144404 RepID=UPI0031F4BC63
MTPTRRIAAVVAGLAAAALLLTGCLFSVRPGDTSARPSPTPDVSGVDPALLPFYGQTLDWSSCADGFQCTTVTAPLDWANPTKGQIELAVIRHPASDGSPLGALLTNPGGPGASGVDILRDSLSYVVDAKLEDSYDVVGFDPRGVGQSTAVRCFDASDMDAYLYDIPQNPRGSAAWTDETNANNAAFAKACDQNSGGILPYITTQNAARDMDLIRAVLGDSSLNYLGYSYGTFLGATYAGLYPDRVGRMVLDGALDPSMSVTDVSTQQGIGFESALRAYMAACLQGKNCPFHGSVDDGMAALGTLLASVDSAPLKNSDGRMLGADRLVTAIVTALYSQSNWPALTVALTDTLQGDPAYALSLSDRYYGRDANGTYTDNSTEAFSAYNCMDYPRATAADEAASAAQLKQDAPVIAPYWIGPDPCDVWPYPPAGTRESISAPGAAPIVVIGTTNDPATPYAWAVSLADQLSSGVLITRVGEGHTGYNKGNACVDAAVDAYFVQDTVPQNGLRCT